MFAALTFFCFPLISQISADWFYTRYARIYFPQITRISADWLYTCYARIYFPQITLITADCFLRKSA